MTKSDVIVLVNREGGAASAAGAKLPEQLAAAFAAAEAAPEIRLLAADEIEKAISDAACHHRRIAVAGGDGTIAAAAGVLAGSETELAVLPLGTLNHFARDLQIPGDLAAAAALAVTGKAARVDVGEINGRTFINNVSVGLYPFMVQGRDAIRERHGWPKWLAAIPASARALKRLRNHRLRIELGGDARPVVTPLLFVGNNRYSLERGSVGSRESLSDGKLSIYAVSRSSRAALIWFGVRAVVGLANRSQDFETVGECEALTVRSRSRSVEIARDGEVMRMTLPLAFTIRAGGLKVVVPAT